MIEIWGRRNASNVLPVMWAVGELGLAHVRNNLGGSFGGLDRPAYRAMNPNRRIPTIDDDGFVLWESNAIVRYLCRRYGEGTLLPDDERACALADQWMEWHKTTPYRAYIDLFWATVRTEPALRDPARIAELSRSAGDSWKILDQHLAERRFVAGDRLTMGDIPIGPAVHRYLQLEVERPDLPHLSAWHARLCDRPNFREHVMLPFGGNPAEWYRHEMEGGA